MQSLSSFRTPDSNMTLGMELECVVSDPNRQWTYDTHQGFWYLTSDGSISPNNWADNGVEFVSQPLPAAWLKKEINRLAKRFQWYTNRTCGIHIHVSRKWLTTAKAKKIYTFYQELIQSEREELFGRPSNEYCRYQSAWNSTRYNAVNNENDKTIEFRMFNSGDAKWARYCVDMAVWLIRNANHLNIDAAYAAHELFMTND